MEIKASIKPEDLCAGMPGIFYKESKFVNDLRGGLSKKLLLNYLSLPYAYYFNAKSSEIIRNITLEVDHFTISVFCILRIF